jgi:hypothetical protein
LRAVPLPHAPDAVVWQRKQPTLESSQQRLANAAFQKHESVLVDLTVDQLTSALV